jgi:hypothetical protein
VSRLRHPAFLAAVFLLAVVVGFGTLSGPCDEFTLRGASGTFEITAQDGTVTATLTEGRIPADGTRHLDLVVTPGENGNETAYRLVGPNATAVEPTEQFVVRDATVDGRPIREGDVLRVVWYGYDLHRAPAFCPSREPPARTRSTLAKATVGSSSS